MTCARPYVVLSCAMSVDGYIDDASQRRLVLSGAEDLDRVDELRASCDAILVGAGTIRRDDPRLLVSSEERRAARIARGRPEHPAKVTITATGLDPGSRFFSTGGEKLVYCPDAVLGRVAGTLGRHAVVIGLTGPLDFGMMLDDLGHRGIGRLMVEGGGRVHTQFLTQNLADEIQLAVAPFFVGDEHAPRFVYPGSFPNDSQHKMILDGVQQAGDVAVLRFLTRRN